MQGIAAAKIAGKRFGRPSLIVPDNFSNVVLEWMDGRISAVQAMRKLDMKKTAFYKTVKTVHIR
jgi:hypothetical protein